MAWSFFAEEFYTADFTGSPVWYFKANIPSDVVLKAIRSWFIFYNSPVFTSMQMRVYSNLNGVPGQILYTFDKSWTLSDVTSSANAGQEIWFDFTNPISLKGGDTYFFVPWMNGYTGNGTSHVAWVKAIPDPAFTGYTQTLENMSLAPFKASFIGAPL